MLISYLLLATSVSIDSLGIGITYGLRNTRISSIAKVILFFISLTITTIAVLLGNILVSFLPAIVTKIIGAVILCLMGIWILYQTFHEKYSKGEEVNSSKKVLTLEQKKKKVHQFVLKSFGITIQIIKDPISSDLDHSQNIDAKEAIYLGIAMSIDSLCVGIGSTALGLNSFLFPFMVAIFQLIFLSLGRFLGTTVISSCRIPSYIWNMISGVLLFCIGISRFFL
ncbi:MAG: sporulation membrane protein YtaF [Clostridia bacterium]